MSSVEVQNAIYRERARIREELVQIADKQEIRFVDGSGGVFIKLSDALAVLRD